MSTVRPKPRIGAVMVRNSQPAPQQSRAPYTRRASTPRGCWSRRDRPARTFGGSREKPGQDVGDDNWLDAIRRTNGDPGGRLRAPPFQSLYVDEFAEPADLRARRHRAGEANPVQAVVQAHRGVRDDE